MADSLSKPLDVLARDLVHDLSNSVSSLMGYTDFLVEDLPEGSPERVFAQKILASGAEIEARLAAFRLELLKER